MNNPIVEFECLALSGRASIRDVVLHWIKGKHNIGAIHTGDVIAFADVDIAITKSDYYDYECEIHTKDGSVVLSHPEWTNDVLFDEMSSIRDMLVEKHKENGCNYVVYCDTSVLYATFDANDKLTCTYVNKDNVIQDEDEVQTA